MKAKNEYSRVDVRVVAVTSRSIRVKPLDDPDHDDIVIGRSTLSYICDQEVEALNPPEDVRLECMTWLLRKEGLI